MSEPKQYTFGDNGVAELRLGLLAQAYAPSTTAFLGRLAQQSASRITDLGCGLGYTTALLGAAFPGGVVTGLDSSPRFVDLARTSAGAPAEGPSSALGFAVHDITVTPFPTPPADLIYGRFILTHLAEPCAVLRSWADVATPGGRLALEETITIESTDPLFQRYYTLLGAMQESRGQSWTVGARMAKYCAGTPWRVERSEAVRIELPAPVMARLHAMNLQTWRHQPFVALNYDAQELDGLSAGLWAVAELRRPSPPVESQLHQLVLRRG